MCEYRSITAGGFRSSEGACLAKFREISRQKSLKSENKDVFILGFESMVSKIIMNQ